MNELALSITNPIFTSRVIAYSLIALLVFSNSSLSEAQNKQNVPLTNLHQWGAVTLFHGLPADHVRAIEQTPDGILWFGTDSGLAKYDGRRIEKIAFEELATAQIRALALDRTGTLWIGTDNGAFRFVQNPMANQKLLPLAGTQGKTINAITIGHKITLASEQGYIFTYSIEASPANSDTRTPADNPLLNIASGNSSLPLTSVVETSENSIILGTHGRGLLTIEGNDVKEVLSHPRPFFIETIATDVQNRLFFGARNFNNDGGLYRGNDLLRPIRLNADTGTVTMIRTLSTGDLWVGTAERGVFLFRGNKVIAHFTFENTAGGLRSNLIYTIFIDREGVVWFGTNRGVCRYDPKAMRVTSLAANAESNYVRTLFQSSDGLVWCGTNRGLFVQSQSVWYEVKSFAGKTIHCLNEDSQSCVYVGTSSGLYRGEKISRPMAEEYLTGGRRFARMENAVANNDSIRALARFQNRIYAATFGHGIERVEELTSIPTIGDSITFPLQPVSLFADGDHRLLIGTADAGVLSYDGERLTRDEVFAELHDKAIWSMSKTADGTLWLATNKGFFALVKGRFLHILDEENAKNVIPVSDVINDKTESQNSVWCATEANGLYKVMLTSSGEPLISHFDNEQGLPSQKTFALLQVRDEASNNLLFIGTNTGIVQYEQSSAAPAITISHVSGSRVYSEPELQAGLRLEYPQNSLLVDVAAISSRTFPKQFQYAFSLQDASGKTITQKVSPDSQMLMRDLQSGSYTLLCRAFTGDLMPSEPVTLNFTVARPPFPFTSAALAFLLLLALAAIWWGYRQNTKLTRTNTTLATTNQQLAETRLQLANETETERRRIARDLHDQTLADLRRLMILTDRLPMAEATEKAVNPGSFRSEIESVSSEIRRICEDLSPSVLENVGLAAALEWALTNAVAHLPEDRKFTYECHCDDGIEDRLHLVPEMQIHLYRIAQEVLNNVSRHSRATQVRLDAKIERNGDFILRIEDNGCGFDVEKAGKKGRGIANIRSRASLIDTQTQWTRSASSGTIFILRRPAERPNAD